MSQQKMLFALVLVAGCVALASSQSFDVDKCTQALRGSVSSYTETMTSSLSSYMESMSQNGQNAVPVQKLTAQMRELMEKMRGLVQTNNFDLQEVVRTYMEIGRLQAQMGQSMMNPSIMISMGQENFKLMNTMMNTYSSLAFQIATACSPALRLSNDGAN